MIKYAEVTIHKAHESMFEYFSRLLEMKPKKDTIVLLFDDETIVDTKNCNACNIKITKGNVSLILYFEIEKNIFFSASTQLFEIRKDTIFLNKDNLIYSEYNCCYYTLSNSNDVFALTRIKSSDESPRFLVAYSDCYFEKEHVISLVNYILTN